ncbi:aspartate-semialdehyde dehydrogenase [Fodinibacter luteus]|uniref:aspartate-semialdehyde dehydrogenase n=1 Tax=Fodinibacter luteus TaxID=552064 RepID=A0ABP8K3E7_9MICO
MAPTAKGNPGGGLPTLAVVGVTGAVGKVVLEVLPVRHSHWGQVRLAAGAEDVGAVLDVAGLDVVVEPLTPEFFDGIDVAIFDIPPSIAREWVELAASRGVVAIDNSTVFRTAPDVPLVVPEVNPLKIADRPRGIIANPGATVMTMIDALAALHAGWELTDLVVTTLQAASGLGRAGINRLRAELDVVHGQDHLGTRPGDVRRLIEHELGESPFPAPLALNVVPFVGHHVGGGWTSEEVKVRDETRKILDIPDLRVSATCVRVPVVSSHSVTVHATFARKVRVEEARQALIEAPAVVVLDDPDEPEFPTPNDVVGADPRFAGRIRQWPEAPTTLDLFMSGDNLRKGAALNMVQTAELVARELAGEDADRMPGG